VEIGMEIAIASFDSISEVNMVRFFVTVVSIGIQYYSFKQFHL